MSSSRRGRTFDSTLEWSSYDSAPLDGAPHRWQRPPRTAMKIARNLVIALAVLVLLYGGAYRFFFRERLHNTLYYGDEHLSDFEKQWHKLFAPAAELDFRATLDRPRRKQLQGHWINTDTGDFVTLSANDNVTFKIGKYRASGQAVLDRLSGGFNFEYRDGVHTRCFLFYGYYPTGSAAPHDTATARTWVQTLGAVEDYETELTRAPVP